MQRSDFRFFHRLRVRWAEVDMQAIVFNANYLMYFDTGITDYWRALALPYEHSMSKLDGDLFVRKASIEFFGSARLDDVLDMGIRCARIGNSSLVFEGALFLRDRLLVSSEIVYVFADRASQTSKPVPQLLRDAIGHFEAGDAVTELMLGTWPTLRDDASLLRTEVFIEEQRIPHDMEWDEHDASAVHAVVRNLIGLPIATGRLVAEVPGVARIGRVAVQRHLRSGGHGETLMKALEGEAQARGDHTVVLHAQRTAQRFYERLGYAPDGEPFEEAGIAHLPMRKRLLPPLDQTSASSS
ncbi:MAG: YbgC/FadM family acyl-CoA thioesterase [Comamonadaceae bacterium]|nr:MAG: YbgC/FadM family acyl-CoA thioesterase [Comamonadaceae bacterium]